MSAHGPPSACYASTSDENAFAGGWRPAPGHVQLPLWPGTPPDARRTRAPETVQIAENLVGGKQWTYVSGVAQPALILYAPEKNLSGAAVVVFPGGGYRVLAIDLEGTEVCDWLVSRGIACVLLEYRVPGNSGYADAGYPWSGPFPYAPLALEDAQRALGLVRAHATEWKLDPHRLGILGFSAGGHLVAALSTNFAKRIYPPIDAADNESCRPDFAVALYPGHLWSPARARERAPDIHVPPNAPPTFLLQAEDDDVDSVRNSLTYGAALRAAHVPVAMHLYAHGGHAFGLRRTPLPVTSWPKLVEDWLHALRFTDQSP